MSDDVKGNQNESIELNEAMKIVKEKWKAKHATKHDLKNDNPNSNREIKFHAYMEAHVIILISGIS
jgi:hypothetical protein